MKILLAIDDSRFSYAATQALIAQHSPQETEVKVLHVVDLPVPALYAKAFRPESMKHGEELVRRAEQLLKTAGFKVQTAVEEGDPKSIIVDHAGHWNPDLVILGSHGRKGLGHFLMGSVSEAVLRHAPCSVKVVRISPEVSKRRSDRSNKRRKEVGPAEPDLKTATAPEPPLRKQVCTVCGKPSASSICPVCVDRIRAEAIARKKREDKGEE